jgi:hypothetical protein
MHMEAICEQRGYSLASVMPCVIRQDGDQWTIDELHPAYPRKAWQPVAVGDLVERGLTAIGITKERVERWTRTEGKPGGCGCEGRKKWLNEAGNKVQIAARKRLLAARAFYLGD